MMKKYHILWTLVTVLSLVPLVDCVAKTNGPFAKYWYFEMPTGGKVYCNILDENARTLQIVSSLWCRYVDDDVFQFSWSRDVVQEVMYEVNLPTQVELQFHDECYDTHRKLGIYTITSLGPKAFRGCTNLTKINLPPTITSIESGAFEGCTSLYEINVSPNIEHIALDFANGCDKFEAINITGNNHTGYTSFDGILCKNNEIIYCPIAIKKTDVKIPTSVKAIGSGVFANHQVLTSVNVCSGVVIQKEAFKNCQHLHEVILDNVSGIEENAFQGCTSLTQIRIPGSVKNLGDGAFRDCGGLKTVDIHEGVITIGNSAFANCYQLQSIPFPKSLHYINSEAFKSCSNLSDIQFNEGIIQVGIEAFCFCTSLKEIKFPTTMRTIEQKAFMGCSALETVVFNPQIKEIERYAFFGCSSLKSANIPKSATFYEETFSECENLNL